MFQRNYVFECPSFLVSILQISRCNKVDEMEIELWFSSAASRDWILGDFKHVFVAEFSRKHGGKWTAILIHMFQVAGLFTLWDAAWERYVPSALLPVQVQVEDISTGWRTVWNIYCSYHHLSNWGQCQVCIPGNFAWPNCMQNQTIQHLGPDDFLGSHSWVTPPWNLT